jgi:iron(III) transport system permease protein
VLGTPAGFATMTTRIYQDLAFSASDEAFAQVIGLALVLVLIAAVMVTAVDRVAPVVERGGGTGGAPRAASRPPWAALAAGWGFVLLVVVVPLLALVLTAVTSAVGLPPVPENLTLANFGKALDGQAFAALGNSLILSTVAACVAVGLSLLGASLLAGRHRRRLGRTVTLTFAMPGSVLAVAVLLAYGVALRDTLVIIALAYIAKLWALGQRPIAAGAEQVPVDLVRAARASGATAMSAAGTVVVPLLAPVLAAAWLLVFVFALHEVTISILLYGPGTATLAVVIVNLQQLGDPLVTSALAVILTALVLGVVALLVLLRRVGWSWASTA